MDFSLTEEQTLLKNSVERFLAGRYDFEARQKIVGTEAGWSREVWAHFAEQGLLAAPFAEDHGGLGGGPVETMVIMEALGKHLVVEPYLPAVVLAGSLLRHGASAALQEALLPRIIGGEAVLAVAYTEPRSRFDLHDVTTAAEKEGGGYRLTGHKSMVFAAPWADQVIVSARTGGAQRDRAGITLFLVDAHAKGLTREAFETVDGGRAADLYLDGVTVSAEAVVGAVDDALPLLERMLDEGISAISAEAVGLMKMLVDDTVAYGRQRKQFGRPLADFQVLQHRMVDMYLHYEETVSTTYMAALKLGGPAAERARAASAAKVQLGKAGTFIAQQAVQLHGGMGVTDELRVAHYVKRLTLLEMLFGNAAWHLRRFAGH